MRHCAFHPDRETELTYKYPVPNELGHNFEGWLTCTECAEHYESGDWAYFTEMSEEKIGGKPKKHRGAWG